MYFLAIGDHQAQVGLGHFALRLARLQFAGRHLTVGFLQVLQRQHDTRLQIEKRCCCSRLPPELAECALYVVPPTSLSIQLIDVSLPGKGAMNSARGMPHLSTTRCRI